MTSPWRRVWAARCTLGLWAGGGAAAAERSHVVQIEVEKVGHIPYGTIHLQKDQNVEQDVEACQSIEQQGLRLQSQQQISGDVPSCKINTATGDIRLSEAGLQNQLSSDVKKPVGPQKASNIFTALGLSSKDLDEVEIYPKDKLTLDSLPKILKQIKKKRASLKYSKGDSSPQQSHSNRTLCEDGIGERKSTERNSESQDLVCKPLVNYGYDLSSGESSAESEHEGQSGQAFHNKERHFSESPHHLNQFDSDSETESDEEVIDFPCAEEQSVLEKKRKTPILQNIKDFLGFLPMVLPHCCSLCDKVIDTLQDWNEHMNDPLHKLRSLLLQRVYPDWVPGELPAAKKNLVEKGKVTTVGPKKKAKMKRNADTPLPSKRELRDAHSRIVGLGNLPSSGFSDFDTLRLGSTFGKVLKYLKVGEKAFLKMDSEMACNNIIKHFRKKPLFYGRLLTADISSAQIQPLLKKPSAKIEEMLNKVNLADISAKKCFLGPILKEKPEDLKKYLASERERSSDSCEREESGSSDSSEREESGRSDSSDAAEWRSIGGEERTQQRVYGQSREVMEHQRDMRKLQRGEQWQSCETGCRDGHERGQHRGSIERDQRNTGERKDHGNRGEMREWRTSSERGEQRRFRESGLQGGGSERSRWTGSSQRVESTWGVSSGRGERGGGKKGKIMMSQIGKTTKPTSPRM
ncbi:matrin-3-like [Rhinoraja longicauda]